MHKGTGTEPHGSSRAPGSAGEFGIVLPAQLLKGVPTPHEPGSAEQCQENDAGFRGAASSANTAMFLREN